MLVCFLCILVQLQLFGLKTKRKGFEMQTILLSIQGAGWFVSHVVITEGEGASARQFTFPCNRWFDDGYDDKKLERILVPGELPTIEGKVFRETLIKNRPWSKTV